MNYEQNLLVRSVLEGFIAEEQTLLDHGGADPERCHILEQAKGALEALRKDVRPSSRVLH